MGDEEARPPIMAGPDQSTEFRRLFDDHRQSLDSYCRRRLPAERAEDAVADVFVVAWRRMDEIPADGERPWLYGVARNVVRNHQREGRRWSRLGARLGGLASTTDGDVEIIVVRRAQDQMVLDALGTLRSTEQELLRLRAWEELSSAEIAIVLGISPEAVDMRLTRAKRRLASALRSAGYVESTVRKPRTARNGGTS